MTTLAAASTRRPADDAEVARAFAALDAGQAGAGFYFGTDHGTEGLHPRAATLVELPLAVLAWRDDGLTVRPGPAGDAPHRLAMLLADPAFDAFHAARARGGSPVPALRAFLAAFAPDSGARLLGAVRFESHAVLQGRAGRRGAGADTLGFAVFAERWLERDGGGRWHAVQLAWVPSARPPHVSSAEASPSTAPAAVAPPAASMAPKAPAAPTVRTEDDHPPGGYADAIARALPRLDGGGLVSLTMSQSFRRAVDPALRAAPAFERLRVRNPAPATFAFASPEGERVFGASPDLQLVVRDGHVDALPVCGTVARGSGPLDEADAWRELQAHEVDAATLAVCSDALRADLAPLCVPGSLQLAARRRPLALATVVHMVDHLRGRLRDGVDAWDALAATAAPPMLVGVPRERALEAIAACEASPRGWYGGLVFDVAAAGDARVGTLLRAAVLRDGVVEVRTGGDLLADSDPAREEAESRLKARSLWRALQLEEGEGATAHPAPRPAGTMGASAALPATLVAGDDPFAASLVERLAAHGIACHEADDGASGTAALCIVVAPDRVALARARAGTGDVLLALGDAALELVRQAGGQVEPAAARRGRASHALLVGSRQGGDRCHVGLYLRGALHPAGGPAGWVASWHDADGNPLVLADASGRCIACLPRLESVLTDDAFVASIAARVRAVTAATARPRDDAHGAT